MRRLAYSCAAPQLVLTVTPSGHRVCNATFRGAVGIHDPNAPIVGRIRHRRCRAQLRRPIPPALPRSHILPYSRLRCFAVAGVVPNPAYAATSNVVTVTVVPIVTPTPSLSPTPSPTPVPFVASFMGVTTINSGHGTAPLNVKITGTYNGNPADPQQGLPVTAHLQVDATTLPLTLFGFLPITAQMKLEAAGQTTGILGYDATLRSTTPITASFTSFSFLGLPIGGGYSAAPPVPAHCHDVSAVPASRNVAFAVPACQYLHTPSLSNCARSPASSAALCQDRVTPSLRRGLNVKTG